MSARRKWVEALNINPEKLAEWNSASPVGKPLLVHCLEEGLISAVEYLQWASDHYGLAVVSPSYFLEAYDARTSMSLRGQSDWAPWYFPIESWDGVTFVACVEPPEDHDDPNVRFVLADPRAMKEAWDQKPQVQAVVEPMAEVVIGKPEVKAEPSPAVVEKSSETSNVEESPALASAPVQAAQSVLNVEDLAADILTIDDEIVDIGPQLEEPAAEEPKSFQLSIGDEVVDEAQPVAEAPSAEAPAPAAATEQPEVAAGLNVGAPKPFKLSLGDEVVDEAQPVAEAPSAEAPAAATEQPEVAAGLNVGAPKPFKLSLGDEVVDEAQPVAEAPATEAPAPTAATEQPEVAVGLNVGEAKGFKLALNLSDFGIAEEPVAEEAPAAAVAPPMDQINPDLMGQKPTAGLLNLSIDLPSDGSAPSAEATGLSTDPQAPDLPSDSLVLEKIYPTAVPTPSMQIPDVPGDDEALSDESTPPPMLTSVPLDVPDIPEEVPPIPVKDEKTVLQDLFKELNNTYSNSFLMKYEDDELHLYAFDDNIAHDPENLPKVSLAYPTFFRIVYKTSLPYHGYLVDSPSHHEFFNSMGFPALPGCATAVPVKIDGQLWGVLVAMGSDRLQTMESLKVVETAATKLINEMSPFWESAA